VPSTVDPLPLSQSVAPASQDELAAVLRDATAAGTPVYPIGGGTGLDYGLPGRRTGIGLSLENLNRVIEYPARDMTITVEAGIRMRSLAQTLAREGQQLPIDAPVADRATLGGVIATNTSGPRRFGYGTMRDYLIGVTAVDGRGTPFKGGGRVVKNVAGYDFCKLLVGSLGTLGVITQATLKLKPLPEASALVACAPPNFDAAERLLAALVQSRTTPAAIELLVGPAWREAIAVSGHRGDEAGWLVVGLEGTGVEVRWMIEQLRQEWRAEGISETTVLEDDGAMALWSRLTEFPATESQGPVLKAAVIPEGTVRFIGQVLAHDRRASIQAHAGNGVIVARCDGLKPVDMARVLIHHLQPAAVAESGHVVLLSAPEGSELTRQTVWGGAGGDAPLMRAVKEQFDPQGLLNPGRFVYGT
jgi:glycolate oxidase FAD binding subunit